MWAFQLPKLNGLDATPDTSNASEADNPTPTHSRTSSTRIDPDLQHLITAWPDLPGAVKAGITAMVQATARYNQKSCIGQ